MPDQMPTQNMANRMAEWVVKKKTYQMIQYVSDIQIYVS